MSKSTISHLIKQWQTKIKKRQNRLSQPQIKQLVQQKPHSLEAKLATSPYAAILASPLRHCTFYSRMFPSRLLLRFGIAWHPETKLHWAYPSIKKVHHGFGYYITLKKKIALLLEKGGYKATFRGNATYRSDMTQHIETTLFQQAWYEFKQHPIDTYDLLVPHSSSDWIPAQHRHPMGYQCILVFDSVLSNTPSFHQVQLKDTIQKNVPCYHVHQFWSTQETDHIKQHFGQSPVVLGVPKSIETVQLSIDLWRCQQWLY